MKKFLRWLAGIIGSALTMVLVLVMLPHATRLLASIMPDESGAAIKASAILSQKLDSSARLETMKVTEEGVLSYQIDAAFIGTVGGVDVSYTYEGSFGIDLQKVQMQLSGAAITFVLPAPEVLADSLTPKEVARNSLYPYFDDNDYEKVLEEERIACRERYLSGEYEQQLWDATVQAFEATVAQWIGSVRDQVTFHYEMAEPEPV